MRNRLMLQRTSHDALVLTGGRVIDSASGRDEIADVCMVGGAVARRAPHGTAVLDASGWIVCPGLSDIHVHLREPGQTHKETIATGTAAAAAGGFTFVACMPNTNPALDHPDAVRFVVEQARQANHCQVGPIGAITRGRAGQELTDFAALQAAGAVAFSDDGIGVEDDGVMQAAFEQARMVSAVLIQHCEYRGLSAGGVMHLGEISERLGLPGLDPRSEEAMIERDLDLTRKTEGRYHVAHISTARSVELIRGAKAGGLPVTAEVAPHHLLLTHRACERGDPNTKMHPPLRTNEDVQACRDGLIDGTIDCIATDHAPHTADEKATGFLEAPPGVVGSETAVGLVALAMIESGLAEWPQLVGWLSTGPAAVLHRTVPRIEVGERANLTLIQPTTRWTVDPTRFESKGRNTPFAGWTLVGRAAGTVRGPILTLVVESALKP